MFWGLISDYKEFGAIFKLYDERQMYKKDIW